MNLRKDCAQNVERKESMEMIQFGVIPVQKNKDAAIPNGYRNNEPLVTNLI